ncbi:MAG: DUF4403 family protein [Bacteroidia bacterium]|nr:DUF4403 family protein [Bacteroidia bacterium]
MIARRVIVLGLALLTSVILLNSCKVFKPAMPIESYKSIPRKPQTSIINLYADLEVSKLESLINGQLDSVLYQDTSFVDNSGDNLKFKAWKDGDVRLDFEQDELSWELPLRIAFQKGVKLFGYNLPLVDSWEYTGQIRLRYKTKLTINPDWSIKTITKSDGYIWTKKPAVKIGGVDIPVTMVVNLLLPANLQSFSQQIDELVAKGFDFKGFAEQGWRMLFNPFKIPGSYDAWLSVTPYSVALVPIQGSEGHIRLGAAITSDVECLLDNLPSSGKVNALPDIQQLKSPSDTFKINLLTDIPYATINRIIKDEMGDSTFVFGTRRIKFETFRVYGTNEKMAVETTVTGSIKGTLYLTGIPYFHPEDTTLRIKDLKFDIKTRNLMISSAKWLFSGKIERMIARSVAIPFKSNISETEQQISRFFNHYSLGYGFELNGKLARLSVSELFLSPESVKANVVFSGNLSLGLVGALPQVTPK